jgi:hypothetical protein
MDDPQKAIQDLKRKAKNRRDRHRYDAAVAHVDNAIRIAEEALASAGTVTERKRFAEELADCHGMNGGLYRRWALGDSGALEERDPDHLLASVRAYDAGYTYESDPEFKIVASYNMVNRLVSRLLYDPSLLDGAAADPANPQQLCDLRAELEAARVEVTKQLEFDRRDDIWAIADQELLKLLLYPDSVSSVFSHFIARSPPDYAYGSVLDVLRPLARLPNLAPRVKAALQTAVDELGTSKNVAFGHEDLV